MLKPFTRPGNLCIRYCMVKVFAGYVCSKIYLCFSMGTSVIQWSIYEYNTILFSLIDGTVTNLTANFFLAYGSFQGVKLNLSHYFELQVHVQ